MFSGELIMSLMFGFKIIWYKQFETSFNIDVAETFRVECVCVCVCVYIYIYIYIYICVCVCVCVCVCGIGGTFFNIQ